MFSTSIAHLNYWHQLNKRTRFQSARIERVGGGAGSSALSFETVASLGGVAACTAAATGLASAAAPPTPTRRVLFDFLLDGLKVREGDLVLEIEVRVEHTGGAAGLVLVVIAGEPPDRLVANWVIPPKAHGVADS